LTKKDCDAILRQKDKAEPPRQLHSFSLLKAALGALRNVVLHPSVQDFFESPDTGIIRAKDVEVPDVLKRILRPYQVVGYRWLVNNARNGLGCVLADDMGLGKTVQAIALMLYMKQHGMLAHPILIVVPKCLLSSWSRELKRWAGDELSVHLYYGNQRQLLANALHSSSSATVTPVTTPRTKRSRTHEEQASEQKVFACQASSRKEAETQATPSKHQRRRPGKTAAEVQADVMLTSYGTVRSDVKRLVSEQSFSGIILDEAQQIKNYATQVSKAVKSMADSIGSIRISLSGTPVENSLSDLHSQFEFILPGYLASSRAEFEKEIGRPLAAAVKRGSPVPAKEIAEKQRTLQRMVQPFVLRRMKTDKAIAADLPAKVEQNHDCELSESQAQIYAAVEQACFKNTAAADGTFARHGQVLAMLHALREVCNHPACLAEKYKPDGMAAGAFPAGSNVEASGKCAKLQELLENILQAKEKVIIFSSYLSTIDLLASQIEQRWKTRALKLIGAMDKVSREAVVDSFQTDPDCPVLLLSLQAGGVGLTLTAATHVIHFDRCYNPAKESQATDRAHRIGQTKTVFVHRLVMKDTFEERLSEIMEKKQQLSDLTVQSGEGWIADLPDEELRALFSLAGQSDSSNDGCHKAAGSIGKKRKASAEGLDEGL